MRLVLNCDISVSCSLKCHSACSATSVTGIDGLQGDVVDER